MYSTNKRNYTPSTRTSDKKIQPKTVSAKADEKAGSDIKKFAQTCSRFSL